jgi:hypothetical protein
VSGTNSGLRHRPDVGFEFRCGDCRAYWPLGREFWDMKSFTRCRACWDKYRRAKARERYRSDEGLRERRLAYQAKYRREAAHAKNLYAADRYWSAPERERVKAQLYYWENRDRILTAKREAYLRRRDEILARRKREYQAKRKAA